MKDGLESKVTQADLNLVMCDNKKCKERGEYTRCYFDIYRNCQLYPAFIKYLDKNRRK
jgi:hypothetical protein